MIGVAVWTAGAGRILRYFLGGVSVDWVGKRVNSGGLADRRLVDVTLWTPGTGVLLRGALSGVRVVRMPVVRLG